MQNTIQLAWQLAREESRQTHHRYLHWVLGLLMVFVLTLSQSSLSVQHYLEQNLENLLGADLVVSHTKSLSAEHIQFLEQHSSAVVATQSATTTLSNGSHFQQVKLKAVGQNYPLEGALVVASSLGGSTEHVLSGPSIGEIWLDGRTLASLHMVVGDTVTMAGESLKISKVLIHEPDRLMEGHTVEMRGLINLDTMKLLSLPPEHMAYRYLVAASNQQITTLIDWQKANLPAASVFHKQGAHPLALFWKRTENFMGLTSIILFFMAAIGIEQLSQVQRKKEQVFSAICISLGLTHQNALLVSVVKWALHIVKLTPIVLVISMLFHLGVVYWLGSTFNDLSWEWHGVEWVKVWCCLVAGACVFQLPIWVAVAQSSIRALTHPLQISSKNGLLKLCIVSVICAVAFVYSDNALLTGMVLVSLLICVALILFLSWLSLYLGERATQNLSGIFPFALYMMRQRVLVKSTQILGVGLCTFLLLFTLMLLKDIGASMTSYTREHNGNLLVSQASEAQWQDIRAWTKTQGAEVRQHKSFMYAQLVKVNGLSLDQYDDSPSESLQTLQKSIRLHWSNDVPTNNRVVEGQWWERDTQHWQQVSVEDEVMTDLGLALGDTLVFYINDKPVQFEIVASHVYRAGGGSITFWVQMPASAIAHIDAPHYSMASIELSEEQFGRLGDLWQQHPSIRMVSLSEMAQRFDTILALVTQVVSGISILIIVLAVIVILSSIRGFEADEKKKNSIILSFGFDRKLCLKLNIIEWLVTGGIAALGAIVSTYIAGVLIYQSQFSLVYRPDILWLLGTLLLIMTFVGTLGVYGSKKSLSQSLRHLLAD
ncbi:FtsX-like permease family protein [Alteromonas sp. KUL49]|uniref:ABC transporter permease n=1 Tax=Alteromonas sp. KUL49 TaxID=2480798 RepID=UPI0010FFBDEE|nr:FtsX-like permease family protein [Alteromonas sp. KUL49]GEA12572.1 ABC transporter permease [Alteromonas sp. KUL49]